MTYLCIILIISFTLFIFLEYNELVKDKNAVKEAFATMDVYLKKRWDLIPNVVQVVENYAIHEKETMKEIVELRNASYEKMTMTDKMKADEQVTNGVSKIIIIAENYPELKANEVFLNLSEQLKKVEEDIANSRKYYNAVVKKLNTKIEMFPSNLIAKMFGFESADMFQIASEEKENVNIKINN